MAFRHVNSLLANAKDHQKKMTALSANLKLWSLLSMSVERVDSPLPPVLRDDIIKVGLWSMRYSNAALNTSKDLKPLIDVNNDMIEGLSAAPDSHPVAHVPSGAYSTPATRSSLELVG